MSLGDIFKSKSRKELVFNVKDYLAWELKADWRMNKEGIIGWSCTAIFYVCLYAGLAELEERAMERAQFPEQDKTEEIADRNTVEEYCLNSEFH